MQLFCSKHSTPLCFWQCGISTGWNIFSKWSGQTIGASWISDLVPTPRIQGNMNFELFNCNLLWRLNTSHLSIPDVFTLFQSVDRCKSNPREVETENPVEDSWWWLNNNFLRCTFQMSVLQPTFFQSQKNLSCNLHQHLLPNPRPLNIKNRKNLIKKKFSLCCISVIGRA